MQTAAYPAIRVTSVSSVQVWVGRSLSLFAALFLLLDGVIKLLQAPAAVDASAKLGYGAGATLGLGVLELACLCVYLLPRTAPLGALLLTGYLGGAVATHVIAGSPLFPVIFPVVLGMVFWVGLGLRDRRVRTLIAATTGR
jgi:hypothetical protein